MRHNSGGAPGGAGGRVELVLQQIDNLPTLSTVATRLLTLTADDEAEMHEVISLVSADPVMTARILKLCRSVHSGRGRAITEIDRAVVMLGLDTVRSAVLSLQVFETLNTEMEKHHSEQTQRFDCSGFWRHSLAVATAARLIARAHQKNQGSKKQTDVSIPPPEQAFVAGLLHDLGKVALFLILPRTVNRVVDLAERQQSSMSEMERRVLGLDHHTAGKRLAEYWGLPLVLQDVMWLHGQPWEALPDLEHRNLIALVTIADLLVRGQHIGFSGNCQRGEDLQALCRAAGYDPELTLSITADLHQAVAEQAAALGLDDAPSQELFLASISKANEALGRLNSLLQQRSRLSLQQTRLINAISDFNTSATPGRSILSTFSEVVRSAARLLGEGFFLMLYQPRGSLKWHIYQFAPDGRLLRSDESPPPPACPRMEDLTDDGQLTMRQAAILPWLADYLVDTPDLRDVQMLPLAGSWGVTSILVHDGQSSAGELSGDLLRAICSTWAGAVAAAIQHAGAKLIGEQLVEANRALAEAQQRLMETRALAKLGELAKGAAHEMNNPLTIISGRSQLLASRLEDGNGGKAAREICEQAHKLSNLITSLHLFASPPKPRICDVDIRALVRKAVGHFRERFPDVVITHKVEDSCRFVRIDPDQMLEVLTELLQNAGEAQPRSFVRLVVQADPSDDRILITVTDDGMGMDSHCLEHAFDPFFSDKPAGRKSGLGLARAQRLIEGHNGRIDLHSSPGHGTKARIWLPVNQSGEKGGSVTRAA